MMKVAVTTSLLVGLTASVAYAQEGSTTKEECPTPEQFKAAGGTPPSNVDAGMPECPPVQQVSAPLPQPIMPVSAPEPQRRPAPVAYADEGVESYLDLAPKNAFELGVQGGYSQPFGDLLKDVKISDITDAGGEVALDLGWRATPLFMLGGTLRYNELTVDDQFAPGSEMDIRGTSASIQGTFHLAPYSPADPYITVGTGSRSMWIVPENGDSTVFTGWEIVRAQVGVDFRVARDFSMGPNAGAALNMFFWENEGGTFFKRTGDALIDDPRPNAFVFAGLAGRFQIGGTRVSKDTYYGSAPPQTMTASNF
ncbi:MAG: hypothetical protein HOV80_22030 [Polyangiaceae bacterium]|nr:hypothetical protein [Polyangiaceae bacterium]